MTYFGILALVVFAYMSAWFAASLIIKRNDIADVAWGIGFVVLAWVSFLLASDGGLRSLIACILVTVWGVRLARHIHARNKGRAEDYRYKKWREEWGTWFYPRSFAQVFLLQGFLLFLVVMPVLFINKDSGGALGILDACAVLLWLIGFVFESVGDAQLARHRADPARAGKLMTTGLWRYTRHPNYFGEVTQWWALWLLALSVPLGFISIIGPLTITILIFKVSGITLLEAKMSEHPDWEAYRASTSVFFPLPPRHRGSRV